MRKGIITIFLLLLYFVPNALGISDSIQISLLTVYPRPNEVYTVYGHTALRLVMPKEGTDIVFNYGTFDFNKPNFIYRFLKGETDYFLSISDFNMFKYAYASEDATVAEQILNIPMEEKIRMKDMLFNNLLPENKEYRYNYFFDNCTTRPRDIIERFSGGEIIYPKQEKKTTFRTLVHECTGYYPWMTFGIDILIGVGADSIISSREEMFLPVKLMNNIQNAYVITGDKHQFHLVSSNEIILKSEKSDNLTKKDDIISPLLFNVVLLIITIAFVVCGIIYKRKFRFFFSLLFLIAGLIGCLVTFMAVASSHPCIWPNFNILWFHPLYFIAVVCLYIKKTYRIALWFHWSNFVLLSLLLIGWAFLPQKINEACLPLVICLWISSGYQLPIRNKFRK